MYKPGSLFNFCVVPIIWHYIPTVTCKVAVECKQILTAILIRVKVAVQNGPTASSCSAPGVPTGDVRECAFQTSTALCYKDCAKISKRCEQ